MKKLLMIVSFIALGIVTAFAQKGEKAIGINLGYGSEVSNVGLGAKFRYGITDAIRTEASFDYFFKKDGLSMWDINLNAHYLFHLSDKLNVYPLAGLTYTNWKMAGYDIDLGNFEGFGNDWGDYVEDSTDESSKSGKFGVNLGAGIEYGLTSNLSIGFEVKYQLIADFNQAVLGIGVAYKF